MRNLTSLEICAGAGGQALGLEMAGFDHIGLVEIEPLACQTLRKNRPDWPVFEQDVRLFSAKKFVGVDLLAGGVPCPPFSIAGKQLGQLDERDMFPAGARLYAEARARLRLVCLLARLHRACISGKNERDTRYNRANNHTRQSLARAIRFAACRGCLKNGARLSRVAPLFFQLMKQSASYFQPQNCLPHEQNFYHSRP